MATIALLYSVYALYASGKDAVMGGMLVMGIGYIIYGFIAPQLSYDIISENTQVDAKASRDIYKLQGGQLALAVGYQYMKEELSNPGTPGTDTGNVVGLGTTFAEARDRVYRATSEIGLEGAQYRTDIAARVVEH